MFEWHVAIFPSPACINTQQATVMFSIAFFHSYFKYLGQALLHAVLNHDTYSYENTTTHLCSVENGGDTTRFFLDFTEEHDCAGIDWLVLLALCSIVHVVSWGARWLLYEPFAKWQGALKSTAQKFSQAVSQATFHIIMAFFAWKVLGEKIWLWDIEKWNEISYYIDEDFKFYYLLYASRYSSDLVSIFYEHRKSDDLAYAIHHAVTILLVLLSAQAGFTRIGGVLMFFFDWADPPMLIGKAFLFLSRRESDMYQQIADICMVLFVFVFVFTRNIIFTGIVYVCFRDFSNTSPAIILLKFLMMVLVVLMTFWFVLILRTVHNQFVKRHGHVDDMREDHAKKDTSKKIE